uniref:Uncharacterized protein n=1 Tax=viral metagenome TaxID=1070528 RepID=A0A6M3LR83_9ZZZZ
MRNKGNRIESARIEKNVLSDSSKVYDVVIYSDYTSAYLARICCNCEQTAIDIATLLNSVDVASIEG